MRRSRLTIISTRALISVASGVDDDVGEGNAENGGTVGKPGGAVVDDDCNGGNEGDCGGAVGGAGDGSEGKGAGGVEVRLVKDGGDPEIGRSV